MISVKKLFKSFKFALRGFLSVLKTEQNFRIQLISGLFVLLLSWYLRIATWQWVVIILLIVSILILEMLNTVFERLVDMLKPRIHLYAKDIKNIMAAMVLVTAVSAVIVGLMIFLPYFF